MLIDYAPAADTVGEADNPSNAVGSVELAIARAVTLTLIMILHEH